MFFRKWWLEDFDVEDAAVLSSVLNCVERFSPGSCGAMSISSLEISSGGRMSRSVMERNSSRV